MKNLVRFIHISDSHLGNQADTILHGINPYERSKAVLNFLPSLGFTPDFIIHTGDFVTRDNTKAYKLSQELFASISVPFYYVVGNHDSAAELLNHFPLGSHQKLTNFERSLCYSFTSKGHDFLVLDANGPEAVFPGGHLPQEQLEIVERTLEDSAGKLSIFVHFPAMTLDSPWVDSSMLIKNGSQLQEILVKNRDRLHAVFFGHIHHATSQMVDGVLYVSAGSMAYEFGVVPLGTQPDVMSLARPSFNLVTISEKSCLVKHFTI